MAVNDFSGSSSGTILQFLQSCCSRDSFAPLQTLLEPGDHIVRGCLHFSISLGIAGNDATKFHFFSFRKGKQDDQ